MRVLDGISKYQKYANSGKNNMLFDYDVPVIEFSNYNGTLCVDGNGYSVGGLIGTVQDDTTIFRALHADRGMFSPVDYTILKTMIEKQEAFNSHCSDAIVESNSIGAKMARAALYYVQKDKSSQIFIRSTAVQRDSAVPERLQEGRALLAELNELSIEDYLVRILEIVPAPGSDGDDDSEELVDNDMRAFVEMYGDREAEMIPGVDYLETSRKTRMDYPLCLRQLVDFMNSAIGVSRSGLNRVAYQLIDRMNKENNVADQDEW
jgi:hypothetical protein